MLLLDSINRDLIPSPAPDVLTHSTLSEAGILFRQLYYTCTTPLLLLLDTSIIPPLHTALSSLGNLLLEIQLWFLRVDDEHAEGVRALTASMLHYVEGGREGGSRGSRGALGHRGGALDHHPSTLHEACP